MTTIIDDFEDGDIQGWSGSTAAFQAQSGTVLSGSYSAELSIDTADNFFNSVSRTYSASPGEFELEFQGDQFGSDDFDGPRFRIYDDSGSKIVEVRFLGDGNVYAEDGGTLTNTGYNWSAGTKYTVRVVPDFSADTFELVINGTTAASGYGLSSSASNHAEIELGMFAGNVSGTFYSYWDDVAGDVPPQAPSNVDATPISGARIDITWDDVDTEDGYRVYRAQSSGSTLGDYTEVAELGANDTDYSDLGLEDGERYYYRVTAFNAGGESSASAEAAATTELPATPPSLDASVEDEITVSWSKQDDSTDGEWELYRSQDGNLGSLIADGLSLSTSSYTDGGLEDGEQYYYTLRRATDHANADIQESAVTVLPSASGTSLDTSTEDEITISWTRNDDSSDGVWEIYRSTDGTLGSEITGGIGDLSTSSYMDAGLTDGVEYHYTIRRSTDHTSTDAGQVAGTTILPAPSGVATGTVTATSIDLSWTVNADNGSQRVEVKPTSDSTWGAAVTGLSRSTTSATADSLRNGEAYDVRVVAVTSDAESPSTAVSDTTLLPDEDQPQLGNGVEDEIAVDRETQTTNYGSVRLHYRETGASSWIDWGVVAYDRLDPVIQGLEDGEEYEVRLRSETEHVIGEWTTPVSIVTKFPGLTDLQVTTTTATSATLEATDNADNEDGYAVERREQFRDGFGDWRKILRAGPNSGTGTIQFADDNALPDTTYQYRVETYTEHSSATAGPVEATMPDDGVRTDRVPAQGWHVVVEDTVGNQITPTIVGEPVHRPRLNDLPTVEIPVPDAARWSDSAEWERQPMRVYYDGERLPIEQVQRVRQEPGQAMLVGVGGVDLRERVAVDVIEQDAHLTAEDLIQSETDLVPHVDDPDAETTADLLQQSADSEAEWDDVLETLPGSSGVYETTPTGELRTRQTAYFAEAEDGSISQGTTLSEQSSDRWSGGQVVDFDQSGLDATVSVTVETDHFIPESNVAVAVLTQQPGDGHLGFDVSLDGTTLESISADVLQTGETQPDWYQPTTSSWSGDLAAGSHTVEMQFDESSSADDPSVYVDAILLYDDRYDPNLSTTVSDNVLQDLHEYPTGIQAQTVDAVSVRQVTGGRLEATINDTSGSQAVAMSNDSGATWIEATNSDTVEGEFDDGSTTIRARFTLGGYDADPSTSPAGRTAPQSVDLFELFADLEDTPLLANRSWDQTLLTILQDIARYGNFIFEVRWDPAAGGLAVEWTQAGQRTATVDPGLVDYSTEVDYSSIHRRAVIYGTSVPRSTNGISADLDTWQSLEDDWLLETGERVVDANSGQEYERSQDYELRPNAGEIKPLSTGDIDDGDSIDVSYDRRIRGTFESEDYAGDYEVFIDDVPSITTERNADAAALAIVQETNEPLQTASVTVDVQPGGLSLVEAVDLDKLPVDEPLEVWSVDNSPGQVTMQLGNREEVSETVSRIQERLGATSRKV